MKNKIYAATTQFTCITNIKIQEINLKKGSEHHENLKKLPPKTQGVYIFYNESGCFKVGRAGPGSNARWVSNNYSIYTGSSTFAKSLQKNMPKHNKNKIQKLIKNNFSRYQLIIPAEESMKDKFSLNLLESLVQYHLEPLFEGRTNKV